MILAVDCECGSVGSTRWVTTEHSPRRLGEALAGIHCTRFCPVLRLVATDHDRSQPVLDELLAFGHRPGLLPKHLGSVPDPLGSNGCRNRGFSAGRDPASLASRCGSRSRRWPRPSRTQSEGLRAKARLASSPAERH